MCFKSARCAPIRAVDTEIVSSNLGLSRVFLQFFSHKRIYYREEESYDIMYVIPT